MRLITDLIEPASLTGFAREEVDQYDATGATLAEIFPAQTADGIHAEWSINGKQNDVATFRAYDVETSIGSTGGLEVRTAKMPALGRKYLFSEYEQLIRRGIKSAETVQAAADRLASQAAKAVVDRLALARGEALATGKLVIDEEGVVQSADFGRRPDFTAVASTKWDNGGDPIADLETWHTAYVDENGVEPDHLYVSQKVMSALMRSDKIRAYLGTSAPAQVTRDTVAQIVTSYGLPVPEVFNARVAGKPLLPVNTIVFAANGAGATAWGTTLEAIDPAYNLPLGDQPGLVVGHYETQDPAQQWIRSNAIALPVLGDANRTLAATVLS